MAVIRTSTGTVQEIATEDGPMLTAAGSLQYGTATTIAVGLPITGADTYFYLPDNGMQEVMALATGVGVLDGGTWNDAGLWLIGKAW